MPQRSLMKRTGITKPRIIRVKPAGDFEKKLVVKNVVHLYPATHSSASISDQVKLSATSLSRLNIGDLRGIHTIGKQNINKNKKHHGCRKCPLRYCLAFGLLLTLAFGIIIAVPIIVASPQTTTTTITSTMTTMTTVTTITDTSTTAAATVTITSNACTSSWIGITMIYHCDSCSQTTTYTSLSFNYIAIATITRIAFALRRDLGYFGIDNVSIRDSAAPSTELLSNGGFETGNFSSWTHCVQVGSTATGSVESSSSGISYSGYTFTAQSGTYYYLGGATMNAEYLIQTFSSVVGHTYIFSFSYIYVGSGPLTSGDFLLSV